MPKTLRREGPEKTLGQTSEQEEIKVITSVRKIIVPQPNGESGATAGGAA
jgi:hypothetical protein